MADLTDSLSHSLTISYYSYEQSSQSCLYIQAAKNILEEFDSLTGISPMQELSGTMHVALMSTFTVSLINTTDHNYSTKREVATYIHVILLVLTLLNGDTSYLQRSNGFIPVGSDRAVCVEVDRNFGVVCLDHASVFCSTCKYGSRNCKHIEYLIHHIHSSEGDLAAALQPFVGALRPHQSHYKPYMLPVISRKRIPFTSTPEMKTVLRQSFQERFSIISGVAHLHPLVTQVCPECGIEGQWSAEEYRSHMTTIVCSNQTFKAEGKEKIKTN